MPTGNISRRYILAAGAFALLPCRAAPSSDPTPLATGENGANLLTIDVQINGKGPFHFVIDTGADRTVIADDVAQQLGLAASEPVMVEGVVRTVRADTVRIQTASVGSITREDVKTPVLPRAQLLVDGYLGLDIIDGYRVTLDFKNRALLLSDPRQRQLINWAPPSEIPVRLVGSGGHLRSVNCVVDGIRATAFIDTGAEISVGNTQLFKALRERDPTYDKRDIIPLTGVTGGIVEGRVTTVKTVKLGALTFEDSRIAIADLQIFELWELADRPALLIGMNWLQQFGKVSVDYGRKELRFDLASRKREAPFRCSAPGAADGDCRYLLGSPNTIPRPSVPT
jgi:predicted aspartyl protease